MDFRELRSELKRLHDESYRWAVHCCRDDRTMAQDVLQSAYLKVLEGKARFDGRSSFKTWMFSVIRNTAGDERRRRFLGRFIPLMREHVSPDEPEEILQRDETAAELRSLLQQLPKRQQEVLLLVFYYDLTLSEAADVLTLSIGSVRTHYERGKRRLRQLMNQHGIIP